MLSIEIIVRDFELMFIFRQISLGKLSTLLSPNLGINNTIAVFLLGRLWHYITHEG